MRLTITLIKAAFVGWGCAASVLALAAPPGVPPLLDAALLKMAADQGRWASTWTSVYTFKSGHPDGATKFRGDPSLPYADQIQPILIKGQPPSREIIDRFRKDGEKRAAQDSTTDVDSPPAYTPHMVLDYSLLNNQHAVAYYELAVASAEDARSVEFDIPLHSDHPIPLDVWAHFRLRLRINKRLHNIEHASIVFKKSAWFAQLRRFRIETDYQTLDPAFAAVPVKMSAEMDVSVLFKKYYFRQDSTWTDYRRVTPYGSRFKVGIGPLRSIGF